VTRACFVRNAEVWSADGMLNYHHLLYFWMVAKEGASPERVVAAPGPSATISGQIHRLEEVLGEQLFTNKGRSLVLTTRSRGFRYAEEIFSLGRSSLDTVQGRPGSGRRIGWWSGSRTCWRSPSCTESWSPRFGSRKSQDHMPRGSFDAGVHGRPGSPRGGRRPGGLTSRRTVRSERSATLWVSAAPRFLRYPPWPGL